MRRVLAHLWLRGYLPAGLLALAWLCSTQSWLLWQGQGAAPPRGAFGRGIVAFDWGLGARSSGFGRSDWTLGVMCDRSGLPKPGWVFIPTRWRPGQWEWDPQFHPGHVKVPILPVAAIGAIIPWLIHWRRAHRHAPHECSVCGYDLRGLQSKECPECGQAAPDARLEPGVPRVAPSEKARP